FRKNVAGDRAGGAFVKEAGAADEGAGYAVIAGVNQVWTGRPSLPLVVTHGEEGEGVCNAAMGGPAQIARDIGVGRVAVKDRVGITPRGATQEEAFGVDDLRSFLRIGFGVHHSSARGLPISQWWPKGSRTRPMRQPYSSSRTGQM